MLSTKQRIAQNPIKNIFLVFLSLLIGLNILSQAYGFSSKPIPEESLGLGSIQSEQVTDQIATAEFDDTIAAACKLIYEGDFSRADTLISQAHLEDNTNVAQLESIISQYEQIQQKRQEARVAVYKEELKELNTLKMKTGSPTDINDVNAIDLNDTNDLTKVLSVIARAAEYANPDEKKELLENAFVKQTFQKAIDKADELEAEGKWLDSYLICYSWLVAIDGDNKEYSKYADDLVDKAGIIASFQDSPCETRSERYRGVTKEIFISAVDILDDRYVTSLISYKDMITNAVNRCKLLADVLLLSGDEICEAVSSSDQTEPNSTTFVPDDVKLRAWVNEMQKIQKEIDDWPLGIDRYRFLEFFNKILEVNKTTAQIPESLLITQFAEAAFSGLDPYTVIVWPQQREEFDKMMTNEFTGIGIEISKPKQQLTVGSLLPDTPAYYSGLDAGDIIEKVDGIETKDMSLNCAVKYITGPAGTNVTLTVRTPGEVESREIVITRAKITVGTIRGWQRTENGQWRHFLDEEEKIGYVRITSFAEKTSTDLEMILRRLEDEGLKGLIIDLRFNTGGLLSSAVDIANKFIEKGPIVGTKQRYGLPVYTYARERGTHTNYPLVILINSNSASASEIVAGALGDHVHNRAILVGEKTHGKGSVQVITPITTSKFDAQLKYTMAHYLLPSGQRVKSQEETEKAGRKDWGVAPDTEFKLGNGVLAVSDELREMLEVRRENDTLVKSGHQKGETEKRYTVEETLDSDPQLAIALLTIQTKLIEEQNEKTKTTKELKVVVN